MKQNINKERNINPKPVEKVWFVYFSTYFYHICICNYLYRDSYINTKEKKGKRKKIEKGSEKKIDSFHRLQG